ncbi:MAG TPA: glutamate-cysteine ligase family protein [Gemmatimonadaceae bacterium]
MSSSAADARARWIDAHLRRHCFARGGALRFGAEMELLAFDEATGAVAPIAATDRPSTLSAIRSAGEELGWQEAAGSKGVPRFVAPSGGALTFEPGGQLEYASAPHASVDAVLGELRRVHDALVERCADRGVTLRALGIDPTNPPAAAPLQIDADRYRRMNAYFATIGPAGARMMRQTASLQLCLGGVDVAHRWRVANAIAPWLVAIFANSTRYASRDTGYASYRAETWRGVDPLRTGLVVGEDPVAAYTAFALAAPAFLAGADGSAPAPFAELPDEQATDDTLAVHLSTLFPDVRPRGYLELRSADAVGVEHHAAAMTFIVGLLADDVSARAASEIVGEPSIALLLRAGRFGMKEAHLAARAGDLVELALAGCSRLGQSIVSDEVLARARDSFAALLRVEASADRTDDQAVSSPSPTAVLGPEVLSSRCFVSSDA